MSQQRDDRLKKLAQLRQMGIEPFARAFPNHTPAATLVGTYADDKEGSRARAAGRVMSIRGHGKSTFVDLRDWTGKIQINFSQARLGDEKYEIIKLLDLGDIVGLDGQIGKTRTGEVTIFADNVEVLAKAIEPLPEKHHGLRDVETRSRHRSLDLIANTESMQQALARSRIIYAIRNYFVANCFIEVETPMMQSIPGGATARPFITHHNALDMKLYLRIAPELYLKRLLCGGMERVFEINRNFRNEGISHKHNPEFTMLEAYQAYGNYEDMMRLTEGVITSVAQEVMGRLIFQFGEQTIDLTPPWPRVKFAEAIRQYAGIDMHDEKAVRAKAAALGVENTQTQNPDALLDEIFKHTAEPHLIQPVFLTHHPASLAPLCRRSTEDPTTSERFELFIAGFELANAYTEQNDPVAQRAELEAQLSRRDEGTVGKIDEDFLFAMEHGMPSAGGLGIGIDRLLMLLLEKTSVRDVILFPLMRPESSAE